MARTTALGQYLRARRELVRPEDVGLAKFGRRRVPGLRREELATLAGISADYYLRLEQGRDQRPSTPVVAALARALNLDVDATAHLYTLAQAAPQPRQREAPDFAPASIEQLIATWPITPAYVIGRHLDVLAANELAVAFSPALRPGVNLVRAMLLDPDLRLLVTDAWDDATQNIVGRLRSLAGPNVDDPRLAELVKELSRESERFRQLWARHDIKVVASPPRTFNHPVVGRLELVHELLAITGTDQQLLSLYHAAPGSPSERALCRLASTIAGDDAHHTSTMRKPRPR